jgi:tRNA-uridine aminocarboxypropyltransferase
MAAMVKNRLFVLILQHPQERRQALSTAASLAAELGNAAVATGLSWPNLTRALGRNADPRRWGVLYLGSAQPAALTQNEPVVALDRAGAALADSARLLRSLEGIVLLDGTWSQAKSLWWRNPWLLKLHRLVLNPPRPARYGKLRREPRPEALSTIEAAALVLRAAEAKPDAADALLAALDRLIDELRPPTQPRVSA